MEVESYRHQNSEHNGLMDSSYRYGGMDMDGIHGGYRSGYSGYSGIPSTSTSYYRRGPIVSSRTSYLPSTMRSYYPSSYRIYKRSADQNEDLLQDDDERTKREASYNRFMGRSILHETNNPASEIESYRSSQDADNYRYGLTNGYYRSASPFIGGGFRSAAPTTTTSYFKMGPAKDSFMPTTALPAGAARLLKRSVPQDEETAEETEEIQEEMEERTKRDAFFNKHFSLSLGGGFGGFGGYRSYYPSFYPRASYYRSFHPSPYYF